MKHIVLSTGREVFLPNGFTLATYLPSRPNVIDHQVIDPPQFRLECGGNIFALFNGKEADEMREQMKKVST